MKEYPKIQSVFKRNKNTHKFLEGMWSLPEFEFLKDNIWTWTEKINGTNIRAKWWGETKNIINFGGKTDKAQIYGPLIERLYDMFSVEKMREAFHEPVDSCLYGEGYGAKIQKGGGNYRSDVSFILFDVRIGEWWLKRVDVEEIAQKLEIDVVPIVGEGTLEEAIDKMRSGFNSIFGDFAAEGIVLKTKVDLKMRSGQRIITKLKCEDFDRSG